MSDENMTNNNYQAPQDGNFNNNSYQNANQDFQNNSYQNMNQDFQNNSYQDMNQDFQNNSYQNANQDFQNNSYQDMNQDFQNNSYQNANQDFQNNSYQNANQDFQNITPSGDQAPKKKKWPVVAGVTGAVVIAAGAAAAYWFCFRTPTFKSPTEAITTCMSQLNTQFSSKELGNNALMERLDSKALLDAVSKSGQKTSATFTLEDSDMSELSMLAGTSIGLKYETNPKTQSAYGSVKASMMGIGGDIGFYKDKDKVALLSDEFLPDSCLSVSKKDITDALESQVSKEESDYIMSALEQQSTKLLAGLEDFSSYSVKQLPDSLVTFAKSWDIKEKGGNNTLQSIKIGDEDYDCYTYTATISSKDCVDFLQDYCTYLAKYDYANNDYFSVLDDAYSMSNGGDSLTSEIPKMLKQLPKELEADASEDDTVDIVLHMAPKGQLLGLDFDFDEDGDTLDVELRFGGEHPGQEVYLDMTVGDNGETLTYNLASTRKTEKKQETSTTTLHMDIDDQSIDMTAKTVFNTKSDKELPFTSSLDIDCNVDDVKASASISEKGKYSDIKKGKSFSCDVDSCKISVDSDEFSQSVELSYDMATSVLGKKSSTKLPKNDYDILNLTSSDIEEIADMIADSKLVSSLVGSSAKDVIQSFLEEYVENLDLDDLDLDFDVDDYIDDSNIF